MMTIDLRYIIPIGAFYAPGLMMLFGGWVLGYSLEEMRNFVAGFGAIVGCGCALVAAGYLAESDPIRVTLFKGSDQ